MNPLTIGDRLWERLKVRFPSLALGDETDTDTWLHHLYVTVLAFGSAGSLVGFATGAPELWFARGIVFGWTYYLGRELGARWRNWSYKRRDGVMDVLVQVAATAPFVNAAIHHRASGVDALILWIAVLGCAVVHLLLVRPPTPPAA